MLRALLALAVGLVALLFLYTPANHPRDYFLTLLEQEHRANAAMWGETHAGRTLKRMQWLVGEATRNRLPGVLGKPLDESTGAEAGRSASGRRADFEVMHRVQQSEYVQAMDGLFALSMYRLAAVVELVPWLLPLLLAAVADGAFERVRRRSEFVPQSPGMYGIFLAGLILTVASIPLLCFLPAPIDPLVVAVLLVAMFMLTGGAIARFLR